MSLDVYLEGPAYTKECRCPDCNNVHSTITNDTLHAQEVTHNLGRMAEAAGIYTCLWRPEDNGITIAEQIIEPLRAGIALLKAEPERFKAFNPDNGWGTYDGFVPWCEAYLTACIQTPKAFVRVSR